MSTAYYALFHSVAASAANVIVNDQDSELGQDAWSNAYRALDYTALKNACRNQNLLRRLPKALGGFAELLLRIQHKRHFADYDPRVTFLAYEVEEAIDACEAAIAAFAAVDESHRRAFVAFALFRSR